MRISFSEKDFDYHMHYLSNLLKKQVNIGLRILGRDNCADDISEYLNIGESTINPILKNLSVDVLST